MFCKNCGKQLNEGTRFCTSCGANVSDQGRLGGGNPETQASPASGVPSELNYKIFGDNLPAVSIRLGAGESIYTQAGGMTWMDSGIVMETNMTGGFMKGLGRMLSGESLFMATYTARIPDQEIVIASSFPGHIVAIDVAPCPIIAQKKAFLCAQPSTVLGTYVARGLKAGFFGGEGFILQRISGSGLVFLEIDGSMVERELAPGETIKVDTGNVAAFEETVQYQAEMVKGFKNILFGGEGLFLTTLTGPGKVWLQTMSISEFAKNILPFMPGSKQ
ncbi:MAG: TIGR00266 family protein [Clostridiaceae bacterium]|nr:TIGR00266 family protein [Clostridiaceae bacterium]